LLRQYGPLDIIGEELADVKRDSPKVRKIHLDPTVRARAAPSCVPIVAHRASSQLEP
jgi:hypothetical protein